jgi:glucoamylase
MILRSLAAALLVSSTALAAPGAPGQPSTWAFAGKTGVGTAFEAYGTPPQSKVWFSLARGVITETMAGLVHEAQLRQMQLIVAGDGFVHREDADMDWQESYLATDAAGRPQSLAYRLITRDKAGRYEIEKHVFTDPGRAALVVRVIVRSKAGPLRAFVSLDPHVGNDGDDDYAAASANLLTAWDGPKALAVKASTGFTATSAGFVGRSDGVADVLADGKLDKRYRSTGKRKGNVGLIGELPVIAAGQSLDTTLVLGFGASPAAATAIADASLAEGADALLTRYNNGWASYVSSLTDLPRLAAQSTDGGKLAYASALVLKALEDKTHPGALIASLSTPWGDTLSARTPQTGYKAVWPRDFYQCAMALLAMGDTQTPLAAYRYLRTIQVRKDTPGNTGATGWFLQKTHVDGTREWVAVQLDQTAMPLMLGWRLWKAGVLSQAELARDYADKLKPAADFLVDGGTLGIDWNRETVRPPWTQQERWEEQEGYSPSTTAAIITGLIAAADMADATGDAASASRYRSAADRMSALIETTMFTTKGRYGDGRYFLRITRDADPNNQGPTSERNGQVGAPEDSMLDAGFLELVRYGVRRADDPYIAQSLPELDDQSLPDHWRVRYDFRFPGIEQPIPGWRRYGNDGYGEDASDGAGYAAKGGQMAPGQRGRVWPFFTGERGHFELARALLSPNGLDAASRAAIRDTYVRGLEAFANEGLMLPEQVWDGVGAASPHAFKIGEGTNSATPLAWTHAEYIKLLRSLADGAVWDQNPATAARYAQAGKR